LFVVDGSVKKVQHQGGGIVGELNVKDGDRVERGQILIRLDDTIARANLVIISRQLDELSARRGRLKAERDRKNAIEITSDLLVRQNAPDVIELVAAEQSLFEARHAAREGQKAQLVKRIQQLRDEIKGLEAQQVARDRQAVLIEGELEGVRALYEKSLVAITRKTALEREEAGLEGQKGQLLASIAQAEGRIAEARLQIIQIDEALREEALKELREIDSKSAELHERRVAAEDQLKRIEIKAPASGFVHQLAVHTIGGVISPAEPAMLIVPSNDGLEVEARVNPPDIDQIAIGRRAQIKLHAFNQRTTPEITGVVSRVSADTTRDQQTVAYFYTIRVSVPQAQFERIAPQQVTAGMQADVYVQTEDRTPLQYLLKPIRDQIDRAFRER
jgi:HlyD family secretion protein